MKYNIGFADLLLRFLIGLGIILFKINGDIPDGIWTVVLLAVAIIFIGTAIMGKCPIYAIFGISSKSKTEA